MSKERKLQSLREQALAYLARREHSRFELTQKLQRAGYPTEEITQILDKFESKNWLSDQRYAESYVADHLAKSGLAKLAYELRLRGISGNIIEAVLDNISDGEMERALQIWIKKYGSLPVDGRIDPKQARFMLSRGFDLATVYQLLKT